MPQVPDDVPEDDPGRILPLPEGRGDQYQQGIEEPP